MRKTTTPNPPLDKNTVVEQTTTKNFLSATLGSNMVLQRDTPAMLWGFSEIQPPFIIITVVLQKGQEKPYPAMTSYVNTTTGIWRQPLPIQPASKVPYSIRITSSNGESAVMDNVLFGDVYLCGGQSNMQFALPGNTNGTKEGHDGNNYPHIRLFTVGQDTTSDHALLDLNTVEQPWIVANELSLLGQNGRFGYFSSVCWFFGQEIADRLDNQVPIGLVSNNWGGTKVELWMNGGTLFNAMIHPYLVGPMKLTGFTWYQGEANTGGQAAADLYAKNFPTMIQQWRDGFQAPDAYFGFAQLSTWCPPHPEYVPMLREAQMAALALPKVGYATNADHGAGCDVHPPSKQYCSKRLAKSAMALVYGSNSSDCDCNLWKSPSYSKASSTTVLATTAHQSSAHVITVDLKDVSSKGLYLLETPFNALNGAFSCEGKQATPYLCAWASVRMAQAGWVNATISIQLPSQVILTVGTTDDFVSEDDTVLETSYGWGSVPMMTLYDAGTDLPVLPWKKKFGEDDRVKPVNVAREERSLRAG